MPEEDLKKSFDERGKPDILKGIGSIHAEFEGRAAYFNEIRQNMMREFSIRGRNLILIGAAPDQSPLNQFQI